MGSAVFGGSGEHLGLLFFCLSFKVQDEVPTMTGFGGFGGYGGDFRDGYPPSTQPLRPGGTSAERSLRERYFVLRLILLEMFPNFP